MLNARTHHKRIQAGFNFIAPIYDFFADLVFMGALWRTQKFFIPSLNKAKRALVFGGGTGRILAELIQHDTAREYVFVDLSSKMIAKAQRRVERQNTAQETISAVTYICGSERDIPQKKFDLIVTPFILDCFDAERLPQTMALLAARFVPNGQWLFADFHTSTGVMGFFSRIVTRALYLAFHVICRLGVHALPDFNTAFQKENFHSVAEEYFAGKMLVARIYKRMLAKSAGNA
ncbi:MAG: class I SAM-dependent methyltransferase [Spirochaetes bacterium]|nr:class I SAM-dependent methyltransferase [Spirochaetota bacterium]